MAEVFELDHEMAPPSVPDTSTNQLSLSPKFDVDKFNRDGYFVIPDFLPPETVSLLSNRVIQLLDEFSLEGHPMTKFSTGEKEAHVGDHVHSLTLRY
jgi:phytanoyl-CoA hydroxylase